MITSPSMIVLKQKHKVFGKKEANRMLKDLYERENRMFETEEEKKEVALQRHQYKMRMEFNPDNEEVEEPDYDSMSKYGGQND